MKILYLDTSSSYLYAGIVSDHELIVEVKDKLGKDLSIFTLSKIEEMFESISLDPKNIDKIIVVNGPGSFTGIRIGITIAKVYAWSLKKQITTITSLEAMSLSSKKNANYIVPILDARRNAVFTGIYDQKQNIILKNQYIKLETLLATVETLAEDYQMISNDPIHVESDIESYEPDILKIVEFYQEKKPINPHAVNPEYLKLTEAEETKQIEFL